ncbi:MAG TPA: hypothetical protein P5077_00145 [bacterium]|nr:hypothetical protein [bacterium]
MNAKNAFFVAFFAFVSIFFIACGGEENNPPVDNNQPTDDSVVVDDTEPTDNVEPVDNEIPDDVQTDNIQTDTEPMDNEPVDDDQILADEEPDQDVVDCLPEIQMMDGYWVYNNPGGYQEHTTIYTGYDPESKSCYFSEDKFFQLIIIPADANPLIGTVENGGCTSVMCFVFTYQTETDTLKSEMFRRDDGSLADIRILYRATKPNPAGDIKA